MPCGGGPGPARDDPHPQRRRPLSLLPTGSLGSAQALHCDPRDRPSAPQHHSRRQLLLAAAPEYRIVIVHTMQAMEDMLVSFYAQIAADGFRSHDPAATGPAGVTWM